MITTDPQYLLDAMDAGRIFADSPAVPRGVFMVEPVNFHVSEQTALDNRYMERSRPADPDRALEQYIDLLALIRDSGIPVKSFPGDARTPDDVFPNNVFATAGGRLIVGHMLHPIRQLETTRKDIRQYFEGRGYTITDLSLQDCIAELTGVMVIDRARRLGFCGMTGRVDDAGVKVMHKAFGLQITLQFDLAEGEYHTNVVMSVLAGRACVVHAGSIANPRVVRALMGLYAGRVLLLDDDEKAAFAGNCIALTPHDVFMSQAAADALRPSSRSLLEKWGFRLRSVALDEIEKAGGSLRCMVGEIY